MFSIVEFFIDGGTIEIVPTQWLHSKESCWWPPTEDPEVVSRLIAKSAPVNESDWTQYSCKLLASFCKCFTFFNFQLLYYCHIISICHSL